mmetsp:Transcript_13921/g.43665  ORF Transcript_13921/g.43665 Transcript_13921/m.43665 type:complete len:192 (-) Transcript_13921:316-891(-)
MNYIWIALLTLCTAASASVSREQEARRLYECTSRRPNGFGNDQRVLSLPPEQVAIADARQVTYLCECLHTRVEAAQDTFLTAFDGSTRRRYSGGASQSMLAARNEICGMAMGSQECRACSLTDPWDDISEADATPGTTGQTLAPNTANETSNSADLSTSIGPSGTNAPSSGAGHLCSLANIALGVLHPAMY